MRVCPNIQMPRRWLPGRPINNGPRRSSRLLANRYGDPTFAMLGSSSHKYDRNYQREKKTKAGGGADVATDPRKNAKQRAKLKASLNDIADEVTRSLQEVGI